MLAAFASEHLVQPASAWVLDIAALDQTKDLHFVFGVSLPAVLESVGSRLRYG